jgi:hypothetical protein
LGQICQLLNKARVIMVNMQISKLNGDIYFRNWCQFACKPTLLLLDCYHVAGYRLKWLGGQDLFLKDGIALQRCNLPPKTFQEWILLSDWPFDLERRLWLKFDKFFHGLLKDGLVLQALILRETIFESKLDRVHSLLLIHEEFEQYLLHIHQVNLLFFILIVDTFVLIILLCTSVADQECLRLLVLVEVFAVLYHWDVQRADTQVLVYRVCNETGWVR